MIAKFCFFKPKGFDIYTNNGDDSHFRYSEDSFADTVLHTKENSIRLRNLRKAYEINYSDFQSDTIMDFNMNSRREKQPINFPSAGSTFKRGEDYITAKLIDQCGLKGYNIGDAYVSEKHAGFIINKGNATACDVLNLIEYVKEKVYKEFNKKIELEIEILGDD